MHHQPVMRLWPFSSSLQYPHAGRILCIEDPTLCYARIVLLAVPSCGSNPMHQDCTANSISLVTACSTLMRVESYASLLFKETEQSLHDLAVPSCGSNPMHPKEVLVYLHMMVTCSTLMRVESYASYSIATTIRSCCALAVPSCGSNPMHHGLHDSP